MTQDNPLNDKLVTVFGGSGFLGQYVVQALLERGARVRLASRHPEKAYRLKPLANLGQLQFARIDLSDHDAVRAGVYSTDAVVNLIGSFEGDLNRLMGRNAGALAQAAKEAGATAFVQISAIGANSDSDIAYQKAKGLGEKLTQEAFSATSIIRPSLIFGEDDDFVNRFARLARSSPVLPVFGPEAKMQPAYVVDCANAIARVLEDAKQYGGKTFELGGPQQITMMELNRQIVEAQERNRHLLPMPDGASALFATLPLTPLSRDQWQMLQQGNVLSGTCPGFRELRMTPKPLSLYLDKWMVQYRKQGRFTDRVRLPQHL